MKDPRAESGWGNGVRWLIGGTLLSVVIVSAGLMIDQKTALSERGRIEHGVLDRLKQVKSEIETQSTRDINLALALADDIADDSLLSPSELNRTIRKLLADNPHISSIEFHPLDDPARMAFTASVTSQERTFIIDIPVPPLPWEKKDAWVSLTVEVDGDRFFRDHDILVDGDLPVHPGA